MKIGIITFWESTDNYGQVLQAYALQQVLKNMGHNPFQIRYSLQASQLDGGKTSVFKSFLKMLLVYPLLKSIKRRKVQRENAECKKIIEKKNSVRKFPEFRNQYIYQSERVYNSINELRSNPPQADCYITGSDQVWTMLLSNEGNRAYYLDFGDEKIKRISYAASFGMPDYPIKLIPQLSSLLHRFNALSVREETGVKICNRLGLNAQHVLDPTLLLHKEDYICLGCAEFSSVSTMYIYSINVKSSEELYWNYLKKYAEKNKLSIVVTTSSGNFPGREIIEGVDYLYAMIPEWIQYINNASIVVTTSFHGVVFCLLGHTNFVYIPLRQAGSKGNGRVESLLNSIGASCKICNSGEDFSKVAQIKVNWDDIDIQIEKQRQQSIKFLKQNIC